MQEKIGRLAEFPGFAGFLFHDVEPDPAELDGGGPMLAAAHEALAALEPFTAEAIEASLRGVAERLELKPRQAFQPIRVAVTGSRVSPGLFESIELLGRETTLAPPRGGSTDGVTGLEPTVLVVDDEPAIRLLCRVNLELDGYAVVEAASVAEARAALAAGAVDVVLLDLHLGSEQSGALIAELHARTPPVPVALVTGSTDAASAARSGADAVLSKPFAIEDLAATVRRLVGDAR